MYIWGISIFIQGPPLYPKGFSHHFPYDKTPLRRWKAWELKDEELLSATLEVKVRNDIARYLLFPFSVGLFSEIFICWWKTGFFTPRKRTNMEPEKKNLAFSEKHRRLNHQFFGFNFCEFFGGGKFVVGKKFLKPQVEEQISFSFRWQKTKRKTHGP